MWQLELMKGTLKIKTFHLLCQEHDQLNKKL